MSVIIPQRDECERPTFDEGSGLTISQILTVLSADPDTIRRPSSEKSSE